MSEEEIIEYLELRMKKLKNNTLREAVFKISSIERNISFI